MPPRKNPLKLNPLQLRTLALLQVLARDEHASQPEEGQPEEDQAEGGARRITSLPHAHGNHVHVGAFVVSAKDASGFANEAVWVALNRKGLIRAQYPFDLVVTADGIAYDTGLGDRFLEKSDH